LWRKEEKGGRRTGKGKEERKKKGKGRNKQGRRIKEEGKGDRGSGSGQNSPRNNRLVRETDTQIAF